MRQTLVFLSVGLALAALTTSAASAQTCINKVRALGERHGIATDPPSLSADRSANRGESGVSTRELALSGGVIEPPRVQDKAMIAQPSGTGATMGTLPNVTPSSPQRADGVETSRERAVDR